MKSLVLPFLFCIASAPLLLALDLTPISGTRELEGLAVPVVNFTDGAEKVAWQPPSEWKMSGGGKHLTLYPQELTQAAVDLELVDRKAAQPPPLTPDFEDLTKWVKSFLPSDATEVTYLEEVTCPFSLRNVSSRELQFSYLSQASRFSTSISIVDLYPSDSLLLLVTAQKDDFAALRRQAIKSMFHWSWER